MSQPDVVEGIIAATGSSIRESMLDLPFSREGEEFSEVQVDIASTLRNIRQASESANRLMQMMKVLDVGSTQILRRTLDDAIKRVV